MSPMIIKRLVEDGKEGWLSSDGSKQQGNDEWRIAMQRSEMVGSARVVSKVSEVLCEFFLKKWLSYILTWKFN